jgi:predicted RNase H-like HicB family nuclease
VKYPIVIHKDANSDYGVTVPDLPGCFSAGRTLDEAMAMAQEAIELHLEGLIEEELGIPKPGAIEEQKDNPDYRDGTWAAVDISPSHLRIKARRVNVTIPERALEAVDRFAKAEHETRSGLLVKAATAYIGKAGARSIRPPASRPAAARGSRAKRRRR